MIIHVFCVLYINNHSIYFFFSLQEFIKKHLGFGTQNELHAQWQPASILFEVSYLIYPPLSMSPMWSLLSALCWPSGTRLQRCTNHMCPMQQPHNLSQWHVHILWFRRNKKCLQSNYPHQRIHTSTVFEVFKHQRKWKCLQLQKMWGR